MLFMRIDPKPVVTVVSPQDLELWSLPLEIVKPNTLTSFEKLKSLWLRNLTVSPTKRTQELRTVIENGQCPLSPDVFSSLDTSDNVTLVEEQSQDESHAANQTAHQVDSSGSLKSWSQHELLDGFFTNLEQRYPFWKPDQIINDKESDADCLGAIPSPTFDHRESNMMDMHKEKRIRSTRRGGVIIAKTNERHFGADQEVKTSNHHKKTSADALDELVGLACSSTRIHIPRKEKVSDGQPKEERVALSDWIVKAVESRGVCVEGKRLDSEDLYWHSNIIVHRIEPHRLKTLSGRVYELHGQADRTTMLVAGYPSWLVEKFASGFPEDWKSYVKIFLDPTISTTSNPSVSSPSIEAVMEQPENDTQSLSSNPDTESDEPLIQRKITRKNNLCTRELKMLAMHRADPAPKKQKKKTANKSPPADFSTMSVTTRSGRQIKPVLKYWCGERISVDCQMNTNVIRADRDVLTDALELVQKKHLQSLIKTSKSKKKAPKKSSSNARAQQGKGKGLVSMSM